MRFDQKNPPREFEAGYENKSVIKDCGDLHLGNNDQVTFHTAKGGQYDVAKKEWGFYATPSLNGRLKNFGLRPVLVRNRDDRFFVLLVEKGQESSFEDYVKKEPLTVICWMDELESLKRIETLFLDTHGGK